jgi:GT2 family glycosyltransferase
MLESDNISKYKILNIVTLYSNEIEVLEYARKLSNQSISSDINLVIVANKYGDMTEDNFSDELMKINLKIHLYKPGRNLGYLNGLIYGYNQFVMRQEPPEWIVMSNTDITFSSNEFFKDFYKDKYNKNIWLIGPSIYSLENKSYDNPQYKNRHTLKSLEKRIFIFKRPILAYYYLKVASIKAKLIKRKKEDSQYSYSLHGCFFFLNKNFMEILKDKKFGPLMYSEEAYLAELVRLNNKKCYYNSKIELIHTGSTVTGKLEIHKRSNFFLESLVFIKKEFYTSGFGDEHVE